MAPAALAYGSSYELVGARITVSSQLSLSYAEGQSPAELPSHGDIYIKSSYQKKACLKCGFLLLPAAISHRINVGIARIQMPGLLPSMI
jgi:hypothetical protein